MDKIAALKSVYREPPGLSRWDNPTGSPRAGFTLLEVVLAIGLCGAVMALLATAIDLYLVRVDTSRTQVETAQLARTLLSRIADDLRAARFSVASASAGSSLGGLGQTSGDGSTGDAGGSAASAGSLTSMDLGIFGTLTELRIDRTARRGWRQAMLPATEVALDADPQDMPQSVEYFFEEGRTMAGGDLAAGGVSVDTALEGHTGLYRRQTPTAAMAMASTSLTGAGTQRGQEPAELLAPEVVKITFMYSDGSQWYEEWNSTLQQGLPIAVEIAISLFTEPPATDRPNRQMEEDALRRDASRWQEYKLLVRIPRIDEPQALSGPSSPSNVEQAFPPGGADG